MPRSRRTRALVRLALAILCLACTSLIPVASAAAKSASEANAHFTQESTQAYERQLAAGEIQAAKFNGKTLNMHLTLKDGRHMIVKYPRHGEPKLVSELKAHGVSVPAIKTDHHKLRYIAAGILIVVLLIIVGVLLVIRRRRREDD